MTEKAISPLRRRLIEDMAIHRLGPKTQLHYIRHVKRFADFLGQSADKATAEDVRRYQLWLASIGTTVPTVNVSATALRFFFRVTLKRHDLAEELVSTREPRRLPVVLSPEEVGRLLASATNIKHKALLSLAYATGLRSSEVVSLKLTDIDSDRMVIRVEQGKGKKDRYVILSPNLLKLLRDWWRVARQKGWMSAGQPWLFPGYRGKHTSARQLHRIVRLAAGRAGITKRVGVHTLRHSFATHLLEQKPIFGSSRFYSKQRHTARQHPIEGRIYYPFHPRCGESVLILRQYAYRDAELVVIPQPDGSVACLPAWMTHESASRHQLGAEPRFSLDILRSLRAEIDALLSFLRSDPGMENANNEAQERKHSAGPVRAEQAARLTGPLAQGPAGGVGQSPAARDRGSAGKRKERR